MRRCRENIRHPAIGRRPYACRATGVRQSRSAAVPAGVLPYGSRKNGACDRIWRLRARGDGTPNTAAPRAGLTCRCPAPLRGLGAARLRVAACREEEAICSASRIQVISLRAPCRLCPAGMRNRRLYVTALAQGWGRGSRRNRGTQSERRTTNGHRRSGSKRRCPRKRRCSHPVQAAPLPSGAVSWRNQPVHRTRWIRGLSEQPKVCFRQLVGGQENEFFCQIQSIG